MILEVKNLSHGFGDRAIFENVSFRLLKGEHIGLIGANGEGKSTFMNIITGHLMPDEGTVEWAKNVRVGYLDQHAVLEKGMTIRDVLKSAFAFLFDMEADMNRMFEQMGEASPEEMENLLEETGTIQELLEHHDFYMIDAKVEEIGRALGLMDIGLDRDVTELSGGQRTKVLMGKLLLEKPDILLLDEPTNYLDEQHIEWLKRYLNDYENAFILISHDIPFLNSVINLIYHMENKSLDRYPGDYDKFQEVYAMKKAQLEAAYNRQQQEIRDLKDFVARNKASVATRNMAMSRQKKLDKMDIIELAKEKPKPEFHFQAARASGKMIFETKDLVIGYDEPLTKPLNISMERGERIALTGANGIGKTTLLRTLIGFFKPLAGGSVRLITDEGDEYTPYENQKEFTAQIGYVPQVQNTAYSFLVRDYVVMGRAPHLGVFTKPKQKDYELTDEVLNDLGIYHLRNRSFNTLSGGQQRQAVIARAIVQQPQLVIMDEPTNHLDYGNQFRVLQMVQKLSQRGIAVILTTHMPDQAFYLGSKTAILKPDGLEVGDVRDVLTESALEEIYKLKIKLLYLPEQQRTICVPY